jgi:NADPH2:quinone reductase
MLRYARVLDPVPGETQVRVGVQAAGVHLIDTMIRRGLTGGPFALPALPMTPGREVAGVLDAVGAGVERGWLGRRVVAHLGQASGGYAELALASADRLHAIPDGMSVDVAVAMIGTGRTAAGVLHAAGLTAGDVVIVTAAAGGLGSLFVQEAADIGATVVALAGSTRKAALARSLGAGIAVDYQHPGWAAEVRDALGDRSATVALDGVGGPVGRSVFELLGRGGRLVRFGWASGADRGRGVRCARCHRSAGPDPAAAGWVAPARKHGAGQGGARRLAAAHRRVPALACERGTRGPGEPRDNRKGRPGSLRA